MRVLVTGDRHWDDLDAVSAVLDRLDPDTVIEGGAHGADECAAHWAEAAGVEHIQVPAEWTKHGRKAGPMRNRAMLNLGVDLVLAFHDDLTKSLGTKNCVNQAKKRGVPVLLLLR